MRFICISYGKDRGLTSFSAAVKELLETHPEIARRVAELTATRYDEGTKS